MILNDGTTDLVLEDDLEWVDEFDWSPVSQDIQYMIGGGVVISESQLLAGRPITLVSAENVWTDKSIIETLYTWVSTPGQTYTLTLPDSRQFTVAFNQEQKAMEAKPLWRKRIQASTDKYLLTLRFMVV